MFQSSLAAHDAQAPVIHFTAFRAPAANLIIEVRATHARLTFGELVWGLYETGVEISRRNPVPGQIMSGLGVGVYIFRDIVGFIRIGEWRPVANVTPSAIDERRWEVGASNGAQVQNSGNVRSSEDRELVVHYNYDGREVTPARMLTVFLHTMTFCAEHDEDELLGTSMVAFSADGFVRLRMDGVGQPRAPQLSWKLARLALRTMWSQIVMDIEGQLPEGLRWEAFSFILEYKGVRIGQGWIG
ncbi:MAG: hypothetical protein Q9195_009321 [Heterodermia aff. obscurata]